MLRIAVVEDHPRMQRVVCGYIEKAKEEFPEIQTRTYCCGEDFLQVKERYDILILDIDLPGISGIELGHRLRKNGDDTAVVFLTAYPQYAAESYVIEAWQYVLKEQMEERFPEILHIYGIADLQAFNLPQHGGFIVAPVGCQYAVGVFTADGV